MPRQPSSWWSWWQSALSSSLAVLEVLPSSFPKWQISKTKCVPSWIPGGIHHVAHPSTTICEATWWPGSGNGSALKIMQQKKRLLLASHERLWCQGEEVAQGQQAGRGRSWWRQRCSLVEAKASRHTQRCITHCSLGLHCSHGSHGDSVRQLQWSDESLIAVYANRIKKTTPARSTPFLPLQIVKREALTADGTPHSHTSERLLSTDR